MCLIACAWRADPRFELLLLANRDEAHARPSAPAAVHEDAAHVVGGRDLRAGGSWLLWSMHGRLAAITNLRVGTPADDRPRSRGMLVDCFVREDVTAEQFLDALAAQADTYGRFNLLLWDGDALRLASNHPRFDQLGLLPGLHVLSNGPFGTPWPKTERIRRGVERWLGAPPADADDFEPLFELLADRSPAHDAELPDTGIGLPYERLLAPVFIAHRDYGTRCSTVLALRRDGRWRFEERRFGPDAIALGHSVLQGQLDPLR